jgi:hypothetical protein
MTEIEAYLFGYLLGSGTALWICWRNLTPPKPEKPTRN